MRRPIVTKRSTANANTEKSIPPAMSQRNQHLTDAMLRKPATTTPKQFQTTWWQRWATCRRGWRPSISNRVPRDPAILLDLQKHCRLLKLRQFWQKRSLQQSHFRDRKHISFLDSNRSSTVPDQVLAMRKIICRYFLPSIASWLSPGRSIRQCMK